MPSSLRAAGFLLNKRIDVECSRSSWHNFIFCSMDSAPTKNPNHLEEEKHHSLTEPAPVIERGSLYIFFLIRSQEDPSEAHLRQDQWTELDGRGTLTSLEKKMQTEILNVPVYYLQMLFAIILLISIFVFSKKPYLEQIMTEKEQYKYQTRIKRPSIPNEPFSPDHQHLHPLFSCLHSRTGDKTKSTSESISAANTDIPARNQEDDERKCTNLQTS